MDIKIGNELLGLFLGHKQANFGIEKDELEFDTDWNDLMHVVDKCLATEIESVGHGEIETALINNDSSERKQKVWIACVHYVQHVNKQK